MERSILVFTLILAGLSVTALGYPYEGFVLDPDNGFTLIGDLGGACCLPRAINDAGQVVGYAETSEPDQFHAFLWTQQTGIQDLTPDHEGTTSAWDINSLGHVVGAFEAADGNNHAFFWTPESGLLDIVPLEGWTSRASGINSQDQVVGQLRDPSGVSHAFLWTADSGIHDLGALSGDSSNAHAINDLGDVVGFSTHPFLWDSVTGLQDLGTLGGHLGIAYDINNSGQVVGKAFLEDPPDEIHAFLWTAEDEMQDLGTLGGVSSVAKGINDLGEAVGVFQTAAGVTRAFRWDIDAGMREILPSVEGYIAAIDINDGGIIVGEIPEPATLSLLALGGLVAVKRRRYGRLGYPEYRGDAESEVTHT